VGEAIRNALRACVALSRRGAGVSRLTVLLIELEKIYIILLSERGPACSDGKPTHGVRRESRK
jgi:hypothetical protein